MRARGMSRQNSLQFTTELKTDRTLGEVDGKLVIDVNFVHDAVVVGGGTRIVSTKAYRGGQTRLGRGEGGAGYMVEVGCEFGVSHPLGRFVMGVLAVVFGCA